MTNPFKEEKPYPIMGYVNKLENDVRKLQWQLLCHRLGSFTSGLVIGAAIVLVLRFVIKF